MYWNPELSQRPDGRKLNKQHTYLNSAQMYARIKYLTCLKYTAGVFEEKGNLQNLNPYSDPPSHN